MKITKPTSDGQRKIYDAPEIEAIDMVADNILCYSTEKLEEDDFDPWATI